MTKYRVMGIDECGSEFLVGTGLTEAEALTAADKGRERFEEARLIFIEAMVDYTSVYHKRWMNDEMDLY